MGLLAIFFFGALAISFLCSLLESVLMSTPISFITMKEEEGDKNASLFMKLKQDIDKPIAAILSLNTIANTIGAAGVGRQTTILFGNEWFGAVSAVTTIALLVFSEIIPKTIGTSYWKNLLSLSKIIKALIFLMYPLVLLIRFISKVFTPEDMESSVSREEVSAMANMGEEEGVIDKSENKVIQNIMRLEDIKAYEVMTPRAVASIAPESMTMAEFYQNEELSHYSRIPVYCDSPENITGYVMRYDILKKLADDNFDLSIGSVRRDIEMFNEELSVSEVWEMLLKTKNQIGLIIDEYGTFQGIITLEDIIETILGMEIIDENDTVTDLQQFARERWEQRQKKFRPISLPPSTSSLRSEQQAQ